METEVVRIREPGEPSVLALERGEVRAPGRGEVLVEVRAAGLNRADLLQRRGHYPAPPGVAPDVPGLEYAGTVAALGEGVTERALGERVMGLVAGGAMARHLVVHARETIAVPARLSLEDAAAVPEVFVTAWDALCTQGGLAPGALALVHAVGSGVGTAAVQLARRVGARVVGTARTPDKLARAEALGITRGVLVEDWRAPRFAEAVRDASGGRGADVILDGVGAAYLAEDLEALAERGTLVVIGLLAGASAPLALGSLMRKRARVIGSVLRGRPIEEKIALARAFEREVAPGFEDGALAPVVEAQLPMRDVAEAHRRLEAGEVFGKLVLVW